MQGLEYSGRNVNLRNTVTIHKNLCISLYVNYTLIKRILAAGTLKRWKGGVGAAICC